MLKDLPENHYIKMLLSYLFRYSPADIRTIKWLKEYSLALGFGKVVMSTAQEHDRIIAFTSQLAHLVSSAYVKSDQAQKSGGFSAGSFRDMTRVAKLSPEMWAELTLDNADHLTAELDKFIKHLTEYRDALSSGDKEQLVKLLEDGNRIRIDVEKSGCHGEKSLTAYGTSGIRTLKREVVALDYCDEYLVIRGRRLDCHAYADGAMNVRGVIEKLEFCGKEAYCDEDD